MREQPIRSQWHCPRCEEVIRDYPAISRLDNKTEICSQCGRIEGLECMTNSREEFKSNDGWLITHKNKVIK